MTLNALVRLAKPWQHLLVATPSDATNALWNLERTAGLPVAVRILRGRKATNASRFFDEAGAALQLPYYFGENWDAFNDCVTDLEWLRGDAVVLVLMDAVKLLESSAEDSSKFVNILVNALQRWNHPPKGEKARPFHVVFQTTAEQESMTMKRWTGLGMTLAKLT